MNARKAVQTVAIMMIANFVCIYVPGLIGLYNTMLNSGRVLTLPELLFMGVVPFVVGDIFKIMIASGITTSILPKEE